LHDESVGTKALAIAYKLEHPSALFSEESCAPAVHDRACYRRRSSIPWPDSPSAWSTSHRGSPSPARRRWRRFAHAQRRYRIGDPRRGLRVSCSSHLAPVELTEVFLFEVHLAVPTLPTREQRGAVWRVDSSKSAVRRSI